MTPLALDTSVAVPLLVRTHRAHDAVVNWWNGREVALSGHAVVETYLRDETVGVRVVFA